MASCHTHAALDTNNVVCICMGILAIHEVLHTIKLRGGCVKTIEL